MADFISKVTLPNNNGYPIRASAIPYGEVDSTSTSTAFTATVPGLYELKDGVCVYLRNNVVTSASGFTININGLGAKPAYSNMANATRLTSLFNVNYTMLFIYNENRVEDGCWDLYRGYNSNDNTIGYQLRTNSGTMKASDTARFYKIYFTSADGTHWVPASVNSTNNATTARAVNQRPIDPFGRIVYTSVSTSFPAESVVTANTLWSQYNLTLGYSFNRTGKALTLTTQEPVYIKCALNVNADGNIDGSAIIDADTPYVQELPTTKDNKIYIFLGIASSATAVEMYVEHPVYYHDGKGIRIWTGKEIPEKTSLLYNDSGYITSADITLTNMVDGDSTGSIRQISALLPNSTYTMGSNSFAEGYNTKASRLASHAEGYYTIAEGAYQHVEGKYNVPDYNDKYAHIVGNGASLGSQSNAHTLEWNGNAWYAGKVTAGANATNAMDLVTLHQLQTALPSPLSSFHTTVGDGTTTSFTINHYLNTKNILVSVNITDNNITYIAPLTSLAALSQIGYAVIINSNDSITISFTSAPASNAAEISIISAIAYSSASDENLLRIS